MAEPYRLLIQRKLWRYRAVMWYRRVHDFFEDLFVWV